MQSEMQLEEMKSELKIKYLKEEVSSKKDLMAFEFSLSSRTKDIETQNTNNLENFREDRKDGREKMKMDNQRKLERQKDSAKSVKKFESSGNDIITGGAGIDQF